jgi:hypothetical protein
VKPVAQMTRADLGAYVQEHLRTKGIDVVLSGGACVAIYSHDKYVSMDLDMIHTSLIKPKRKNIREAMSELDFIEDGRYFKHGDTNLFVEFPPGPPAVGEEPVKEIIERQETTGILKIISPTDCVKDRLTGFYYDNDLQCLDQAILVAQDNQVDINEVERWSKQEGELKKFSQIREKLCKNEFL